MKILVINSGSSSLKYQLISMEDESVISKGNCERIGNSCSVITYKTLNNKKQKLELEIPNHAAAFMIVKQLLLDDNHAISDLSEISAIGHRIVQGGNIFKESVLINETVINKIKSISDLAPLHTSAHIQSIKACIDVFGEHIPQVAVFDTAFHSTMPPKAYMFAIPYEYYEKYSIRKYGFHGTSHRYVSDRCAKLMDKDIKDLKIITCHLGNGSSMAAINAGKVLDTTMGFTPLDGIIMGTRSGSIDPSIVTFIQEKENLTPKQMNQILNNKSGILGISGISNDDRDITREAKSGNQRAILTQQMLQYQVTKLIGSYVAAMNGCDAIVFTAGLGENQSTYRKNICNSLSYFGIEINDQINMETIKGVENEISTPNSKIKVFVIPTNEEVVIARDTMNLIKFQ